MNRAALQAMSEDRIKDAESLLSGKRFGFAYYVAGYAVECALKSCVLSRMPETGGVFIDKKFSESCFTHDFGKLIELAGLKDELNAMLKSSTAFVGFWLTVKDWDETSRYKNKTDVEAKKLYEAITNDPDGVLKWLRIFW